MSEIATRERGWSQKSTASVETGPVTDSVSTRRRTVSRGAHRILTATEGDPGGALRRQAPPAPAGLPRPRRPGRTAIRSGRHAPRAPVAGPGAGSGQVVEDTGERL